MPFQEFCTAPAKVPLPDSPRFNLGTIAVATRFHRTGYVRIILAWPRLGLFLTAEKMGRLRLIRYVFWGGTRSISGGGFDDGVYKCYSAFFAATGE